MSEIWRILEIGLQNLLISKSIDNSGFAIQSRRSMGVSRGGGGGNNCLILTGHYATFTINEVLGRIDCPPEPRLLYLKAQLHAYTSFILPDPLTRRTGTEEALHILSSGYCQPWTPLDAGAHVILQSLAKLTPRRGYYSNHKYMQTCIWKDRLTTSIQHDDFRAFVENIMRKSSQLDHFALEKSKPPSLNKAGDSHLTTRSWLRREAYQRQDACPRRTSLLVQDSVYVPRGGPMSTQT